MQGVIGHVRVFTVIHATCIIFIFISIYIHVYPTYMYLNTYPLTGMIFTFHHSVIIKVIFLVQSTGLHKFFEPKHVVVTIKF